MYCSVLQCIAMYYINMYIVLQPIVMYRNLLNRLCGMFDIYIYIQRYGMYCYVCHVMSWDVMFWLYYVCIYDNPCSVPKDTWKYSNMASDRTPRTRTPRRKMRASRSATPVSKMSKRPSKNVSKWDVRRKTCRTCRA